MTGEELPPPVSFPRSVRLRTPGQFKSTLAQGRRLAARLFKLHVWPAEANPMRTGDASPGESVRQPVTTPRLGISVSRRVDTRAVERNRIRRVARESFRHARAGLPAGNYVLLAQREAAGAPSERLREALDSLWQRARALKPLPSAPTMRIPAPSPQVQDLRRPPIHDD